MHTSGRVVDVTGLVVGPVHALFADPRWQRTSSPQELAIWLRLLERELASGALGIGVLLGYAPQSAPSELWQSHT